MRDLRAQTVQQILSAGKTLVFIGCGEGLRDPNFKPLFQWLKENVPGSPYPHYRLALKRDVPRLVEETRNVKLNITIVDYDAGNEYRDLVPYLRTLVPGSDLSKRRPPVPLRKEVIPLCPYPELLPYDRKFSHYFHGREDELDQIFESLPSSHFHLILGSSGSGKSSLIFGGVLPRLEQDYSWKVLNLQRAPKPASSLEFRLEGVSRNAEGAVTRLLESEKKTHLLIVVDQLEECFTQAEPEERLRFFRMLSALQNLSNCTLLLALRAAYLEDLMDSPLLRGAPRHRIDLSPLEGAKLRDAITLPAGAVDVEMGPALIEMLLQDAADELGRLPLLQATLEALWNEVHDRKLSLATYQQLSGSGRCRLAVALGRKADDALASLAPEQQYIARRCFLRLAAFVEGRPDTRRQQRLSALCVAGEDKDLVRSTIQVLSQAHLVTLSSDDADEELVDLVHESLISGWPRLRSWLAEGGREAELVRRRFEGKAAEWARLKREGGFLDKNSLAEVESWLTGRETREASQLLLEFVLQSKGRVEESDDVKRAFEASVIETDAATHIDRDPERAALLAIESLTAARDTTLISVPQADEVIRRTTLNWPEREVIRFPDLTPSQALFDWGNQQIAVGTEEGALLLCSRGQERTAIRAKREAKGALTYLAVNSTATRLAAGDVTGTVELFDWRGKHEAMLHGHSGEITAVAVSPSDQYLTSVSRDCTAILWNIRNNTHVRTFEAHPDLIRSVSFNNKSDHVITTCDDGIIRIWNVLSGENVMELVGHVNRIWAAEFHPRETDAVISAGEDCTLKVWNARTGQNTRVIGSFNDPVRWLRFQANGSRMVTISGDHIKIWDFAKGSCLRSLRIPAARSANFDRTGSHLVVASATDVFLIDLEKIEGRRPIEESLYGLSHASYHPNGEYLVLAGIGSFSIQRTNVAEVFKSETGSFIRRIEGHAGGVLTSFFSVDGTKILTTSEDRTARVWSSDGKLLLKLAGVHQDRVSCARFTRYRQFIGTVGSDGTAAIWSSEGAILQKLKPRSTGFRWAAFSDDETLFAIACSDGRILIWKWEEGDTAMFSLDHSAGPLPASVRGIAFSSCGDRLVSGGDDGLLRLWDLSSRTSQVLKSHDGGIASVDWSADGITVASGGIDGTVRLWNPRTGVVRASLVEHASAIQSVTFSSDSRWILSTSSNPASSLKLLCQNISSVDALIKFARARMTDWVTDNEHRAVYVTLQAGSSS